MLLPMALQLLSRDQKRDRSYIQPGVCGPGPVCPGTRVRMAWQREAAAQGSGLGVSTHPSSPTDCPQGCGAAGNITLGPPSPYSSLLGASMPIITDTSPNCLSISEMGKWPQQQDGTRLTQGPAAKRCPSPEETSTLLCLPILHTPWPFPHPPLPPAPPALNFNGPLIALLFSRKD